MALRTILVLALAALIAVACGGDDDDDRDDSGTTTPSAAQTETAPGGSDTTGGRDDDSTSAGDDGDGAQGGDGSLTRAAFIRRADSICTDARRELGDKGQGIAALARRAQSGKLEPDDYFRMSAKLLEESAEAADGAVDQLEDLPRPEARRAAGTWRPRATRSTISLTRPRQLATATRERPRG